MALTVPSLKKFFRSATAKEAIAAYLVAKAFAESERARVDAYIKPAFAEFIKTHPFYVDDKGGRRPADLIEDEDRLFMSNDEEGVAAWYAEADRLHKANGSELPEGYNPALVAEHELTKAENALLKLAAENIDPVFGKIYNLEKRADAIRLIVANPESKKAA